MPTEAVANGLQRLDLVVHSKQAVCDGVVSLELRSASGEPLPPFSAGAHLELTIPTDEGAVVRHYSLCNDPGERHRYVVGVGRATQSRGGSRAIHESVAIGDRLVTRAPRNNFELYEAAAETILLGGGIGITPLLAMARRLSAIGQPWVMYLCAPNPARAPFLEDALALPGTVIPIFDGMPGVARLDLAAVVARAAPATHLYCCGPAPMMAAFVDACVSRPKETVHLEWFTPPVAPAQSGDTGEFEVDLARSKRTLHVPKDRSILDVLLEAGVEVPFVCNEGICGSCETRVLAGTPVHLDVLLQSESPSPTDRMMVCVSRCCGPSLQLDL